MTRALGELDCNPTKSFLHNEVRSFQGLSVKPKASSYRSYIGILSLCLVIIAHAESWKTNLSHVHMISS